VWFHSFRIPSLMQEKGNESESGETPLPHTNATGALDSQGRNAKSVHTKKKLLQQSYVLGSFPKDEKIIKELGTDTEKILFLAGFVTLSSFKRRAWLWRGCLPDVIFAEKEARSAEGTILQKS
jgi:hypothetical protein